MQLKLSFKFMKKDWIYNIDPDHKLNLKQSSQSITIKLI